MHDRVLNMKNESKLQKSQDTSFPNAESAFMISLDKRKSNNQEIRVKVIKRLLDLIVLDFLSQKAMCGYQIMTKIRNSYGIYLGVSRIYTLLKSLEKNGYVKNEMEIDVRLRKVYKLTASGKKFLDLTKESVNIICNDLAINNRINSKTVNPSINAKSTDLKFRKTNSETE